MQRKLWSAGALALAAVLGLAPSAFAADSVYGGSTSRGDPIAVTADKAGKKLRSVVIAWNADCSDGSGFPDARSLRATKASAGFEPGEHDLPMSRNGKGRFAGTDKRAFASDDAVYVLRTDIAGKLRRTTASGTLKATVSILDKAGNPTGSCTTGRMSWKASRSPGRVYAGKTSQDEPVVARLDAKRKRVTDLLVSWYTSSCQPDGFGQFPEQLANFGLSSGRFGSTWDETQSLSDGGKVLIHRDLAGKVGAKAASGTLRVGLTFQDASGATTRSCDSGGMTWKATTG